MSGIDWSLNLNSLILGGMALGGAIVSTRATRQRGDIQEKQAEIHQAVNGNLTEKLAELPTRDETARIAAELAATAAEQAAAVITGPHHVVIDAPIPTREQGNLD